MTWNLSLTLLLLLLLQTSCVGLEEYTQLIVKWGVDVARYFGEGWQDISELQQLRSGAPRRKWARRHIALVRRELKGCIATELNKAIHTSMLWRIGRCDAVAHQAASALRLGL
jgi:hypothetical protein